MPSFLEYIFSLRDIWKDQYLTNNGKQYFLFLEELSEFIQTPNIGICSSGTSTEECLLELLKVKNKTEIITTPYSFISTSNAIIRAGLKPVFVDIDEDLSLNIDQVRDSINERTLAIMPVDVYGIPNNINLIKKVISKRNIKLIIDKSHSFGVKIGSVSSLKQGDFTFASMHATKVMSSIEGGILYSKNRKFIKSFKEYINFGFEEEDAKSFGTNGKIDELRCLFGRQVLAAFEKIRRERKKVYNIYKELGLTKLIPKSLRVFEEKHIWNYSYLPILLRNRDEVYQDLFSKGINTKKYFQKIIPEYSIYKRNQNAWITRFPLDNARKLSESILTLPLYSGLSKKDIMLIINSLNKIHDPYDMEGIQKFIS
tara:strand:- start:94 stop:1203 length:1110 start_codon:yes stop_codon:yes gene_type:complete